MSPVAVVNGQPPDPTSAASKENNQTTGPPIPVPSQTQSAGPILSQAQSSQSQVENSAVPQTSYAPQRDNPRSKIYRYSGPKPLFAAAWANKNDWRFRLAVGSIVEREEGNNVTLIELDESLSQLVERGSFSHEFPANKIGFIPDLENKYPDLLATSADFLRLWRIHPDNLITEEAVLRSPQFDEPLTSFDWNEVDPRLIGTSSIDTTCTIYDVEAQQAVGLIRPITFTLKTQLLAHDKPVHDIAFSRIFNGKDNFATVGADGSARMFDLRHLKHSTIVYEDPLKLPLMRVAWNKQEHYQLATFAQDSAEVIIIDIRMPCSPLARLKNHNSAVNGLAWAPHSAHRICTASDDAQALIWDLQNMPRPVEDPILAYKAGGELMRDSSTGKLPIDVSSPFAENLRIHEKFILQFMEPLPSGVNHFSNVMLALSSATALMCSMLVALARPKNGKDSPEPEESFDQSVYKEFLAAIHYNERDKEADARHIEEDALKAKYGENRLNAAQRVRMTDDINHVMVEVAKQQRARLENTG